MIQQTMSIDASEYNNLLTQIKNLTAERAEAWEMVGRLRAALGRLALLKEDIPDEMADNAFVFDIPVWLIRQVREDLESALVPGPAGGASHIIGCGK